MSSYYIRKGLNILREKGLIELAKSLIRFSKLGYRRTFIGDIEFTIRCTWNKWNNQLKWDAPADPFNTILINPDDMKFTKGSAAKINKYNGLGQISGGSWDKHPKKLNEHPTHNGLKQRFEEGMSWEETIYVKRQYQKFENVGKCSWGHDTPADFIENRCSFVDNLHDSIRDNGYICEKNEYTNRELDDTNLGRAHDKLKPHHKLEPLICIGRNGEYILIEGHHRVTISNILNLNNIPVNVLCRHEKWQETRDRVYNEGISAGQEKKLIQHPDLQDILTGY